MERPDILTILPHLLTPAVVALAVLVYARRRGATRAQVEISFGAAMLGAFMTASGWVFASYLGGEKLSAVRILGSQVLVAGTCGVLAFFGTMSVERDLTDECDTQDGRQGQKRRT